MPETATTPREPVLIARFRNDPNGYVLTGESCGYPWSKATIGRAGNTVRINLDQAYLIEETHDGISRV